jgi:gamma-glutamyl hercynylcysteine S-oxide synthase
MIRTADAPLLRQELVRVRALTLAMFEAYVQANALDVPQQGIFNLPLWELGHIAWFQQWWIGRNAQRHLGAACNPEHPRLPCTVLQTAHYGDAWYDSSSVPHAQRWQLPLQGPQACKDYLAQTQQITLDALDSSGSSDEALYFFRLVLLHEAMHLEAGLYMAQALQQPFHELTDTINSIANYSINVPGTPGFSSYSLPAQVWRLGHGPQGFVFDNELGAHQIELAAFEIDAQPVRWRQYLRFVEAAGYGLPACLRRRLDGSYEHLRFGHWQALDEHAHAVHLSWHDAQAYCLWAGRRLPSEAEWECAAMSQNLGHFSWGQVWEWTASDFQPYPGFASHPYRDYSQPWFGSRKVLRGASTVTLDIMHHPKYRNYFTPERNDIFSGFRTCAL